MNFFRKLFNKQAKPEVLVKQEPKIVDTDWGQKCRDFERFVNHSSLAKLFSIDAIPFGALPVYDLDGGEKTIITIENGKPKYLKTEYNRITLQLQEKITEDDILNCLLLATKLAEPTDYVNEYARSGGWASVSGNKLENRMYNNVYIKDFPRTLLLPEAPSFGIICQGTANEVAFGMGLLIILEKVRVVRE